ncbi:dTDP-4-amino-4,6-dideoxygalactose transaminase [Nitrobacter vulgaris]|jgi:dTDP-4-amino-4,6-dideoxygalactose transaminase|nr:dTDP-4-amino-4,6-dideoxygalactose transaminase [Nitrobacter vulgaris]
MFKGWVGKVEKRARASSERRHSLRQSELAQDHAILLPIYAQMTEDDQVRVADALRAELS